MGRPQLASRASGRSSFGRLVGAFGSATGVLAAAAAAAAASRGSSEAAADADGGAALAGRRRPGRSRRLPPSRPASWTRSGAAASRSSSWPTTAYPARLRRDRAAAAGPVRAGDAGVAGPAGARSRSSAPAGRRRSAAHRGRIADAVAGLGATVVSGLALGIDGAAHAAAVGADADGRRDRRGPRAAVPGRPPRPRPGIVDGGGAVVSEFAPETTPSRGTFPRRNRIISGLADATVVVEAGARSGALTTAAWALEQGRGLFLVPGRLDDPRSPAASRSCARPGPRHASSPGIPELLEDLGLVGDAAASGRRAPGTRPTPGPCSPPCRPWSGRSPVPWSPAGRASTSWSLATGLGAATVLGALTALEIRGLVIETYGRYRAAGPLAAGRPTPHTRRSVGRLNPTRPAAAGQPRPARPPGPTRGGILTAIPAAGTEPPIERPTAAARRHWHAASHLEDDVLRKPGAVLLAAPVALGAFSSRRSSRRSPCPRVGVSPASRRRRGLSSSPSPSPRRRAFPSRSPPVSAALFVSIGTAHDPSSPFRVEFDQPMDRASVAARSASSPPTAYTIDWDADRQRVATLVPADRWHAGHAVPRIVGPAARSAEGGTLAAPLRSVVLTDGAGIATIAPTMATPTSVRLNTSFRIRLDRPATARRGAGRAPLLPAARGRSRRGARHRASSGSSRSARWRPTPTTACGSRGSSTPTGSRSSHGRRSRSTRSPRRPSPASGRGTTPPAWSARPTITRPLHPADGPVATADAVHVTADGKAVAGRVTWSPGRHDARVPPEEAAPVRGQGHRQRGPDRSIRRRRRRRRHDPRQVPAVPTPGRSTRSASRPARPGPSTAAGSRSSSTTCDS